MPPTVDPQLLDALSVPIGDLIASVGRGVADAQREMDIASLAALRDIYENTEGLFLELQRIGYRPNWYHIPEVEGEIQVALTVAGQQTVGAAQPGAVGPSGRPGLSKVRLYAAPVDAGYASRFGFSLQATSKVRFRIVPIPPSTPAEALQVMPALVGLDMLEARARLALLRIAAELPDDVADTARVTAQTPAAGSLLAAGTVARVETA